MNSIKQFPIKLQELLLESSPKEMTYKELPREAQLAMAHYMSVDGAAWAYNHPKFEDWKWGEGTPYKEEQRKEMLKDLNEFLPRFIRYFGNERFGYCHEVNCEKLKAIIIARFRELNDFEAIEWDLRSDKKMGAYETPTWPSILHDEEILQDGWTRFNDRLCLGIETTPVIWYIR